MMLTLSKVDHPGNALMNAWNSTGPSRREHWRDRLAHPACLVASLQPEHLFPSSEIIEQSRGGAGLASNVSGLHTPRLEARRGALKKVFSQANMELAWKKYVRKGLRKQEVFDLFDYNDFHWNRGARFADLRRAILAGRYKPNTSIPVKLEKSLGICRTIVIPTVEDAVVLQCIVENLLPSAMKRQPSRNTFFSRSHQQTIGDFKFDSEYIWFKQWRKFARRRLELTSTHQWVVTTDIATFFDNVRYEYLRNIISTFNNQQEVVLDILFALLDELSWRPD
jgi:hypothetical protein